MADVAIVADSEQESFLRHATSELGDFLGDALGAAVPIVTTSAEHGGPLICIGNEAGRRILGTAIDSDDIPSNGYVLRSFAAGKRHVLVIAGSDAHGTQAGVYALMKHIALSGKTPTIEIPLDVRSNPSFSKRGMHFNGWPFGYPYTFRKWREADWQHYLDILAYQHVNLFYLWPFIEIMPVPLSAEDKAYLAECRRVVDYAQRQHGMEVWIMHCTNRVAQDDCGVADPRERPYWRPSQKDLNPGDPQDFAAIMAARAALYQALDNADGFCNIDSDPGYYIGSPLEDYIKVLQGCRDLLDEHTARGKQTKLIDWMWIGWGIKHIPRARNAEHQARTLDALQTGLREPWGLAAGSVNYLPACRERGLIGKTILLEYGMIEAEPAYPHTNVAIDTLRQTLTQHFVPNADLAGAMGNMQTPLLQFPHMVYFTSSLWDLDYRKTTEADLLAEVARLLYPEHHEIVAECYGALKSSDSAHATAAADRLNDLIDRKQLGRPGLFGRKLFPDKKIVAESLVLQLRLQAATEQLMRVTAATTPEDCRRRVRDCLDASIAWGDATGWPALWGKRKSPLEAIASDPRYLDLPFQMALCLKDRQALNDCMSGVIDELSTKYDRTLIGERGAQRMTERAADALGDLALTAAVTASDVPVPDDRPPQAAIDGRFGTIYSPGPSTEPNDRWLQLSWDRPQHIKKVVVRFAAQPSAAGRVVRLEHMNKAGAWEQIGTATIPDGASPQTLTTLQLAEPIVADKIRVVNLIDLHEIEVY